MEENRLNRRKFLMNSSIGLLGAAAVPRHGMIGSSQNPGNEQPVIKGYRTLGRTGFRVSDIGFGFPRNPGLIRTAIERGVNYFDTARFYENSENDLGKVIGDFDRESLFITTKLHTGNLGTKEDILEKLDRSFVSLNTAYVDCLILQGVDSVETVRQPAFHAAFDQLKREGKVKYRGISCHSPASAGDRQDTMQDILMSAIDDGRFDLMLLVYNFLFSAQGEHVLKACRQSGIATTIMKTNPVRPYFSCEQEIEQLESANQEIPERLKTRFEGLKKQHEQAMDYLKANGISRYDEQLGDVATRFVLSNQDVECCLINFQNFRGLEQYLGYSGRSLDPQAMNNMEVLRNALGRLNCRIGCNECESHCPARIPVNTILRYHYYFTAKGQQKHAMEKYAALPGGKADQCMECEGFCEKACPYGVLTRPLLAMAHRDLTFAGGKVS